MKTIINVKKNTDNKFLNLYTATYNSDGKEYDYFIASRRNENDLSIYGINKVDAVRILPYIKRNNKIYVVLIYEFRHAIGEYMYSVPAGLVENGESCETAAVREIREEIGGKIISLDLTEKGAYISPGMTDEKIALYEAEVKLVYKQSLDQNEDIKVKIIEASKLNDFLSQNHFGLLDLLQIKNFLQRLNLENIRSNDEENSIIHR